MSPGPADTKRWLLLAALLAPSASLSACEGEAFQASEFRLALETSQGPGLPADVAFLRVLYRVGDAEPVDRVENVQELQTTDGVRRLALEELPAASTVSVRIEGLLTNGLIAYVGSIGPLVLGPGERLNERVTLVNANVSQSVTGAPPARFLHGATRLADGRVLISGGFAQPVSATCPVGAAQDARCYRAQALEDAWLFDPDSMSFVEVAGGLLEPRAGHSSTLLPDGRVLTAGGAREALLLFEAGAPNLPRFIPADSTGGASVSSTFEVFEPDAGASSLRDLARGRFVGSAAAPTEPGPLLTPRFLQGAAENLDNPGQVLLAGGIGSVSSQSYELFDANRPGGYGSSTTATGSFAVARQAPTALAMVSAASHAISILSGSHARSNSELAELWSIVSTSPAGSVEPGTGTAFPQATVGAPALPRPEYAFPQVLGARFGGLTHALVAGAYPPYCGESPTPVFPPTRLLDFSGSCSASTELKRCMLLDATTGTVQPCATLEAHLAGAAAELSDGSVLLSGGLNDLASDMSLSLERFGWSASEPTKLTPLATMALVAPRAFHTSSALPEGGALSVGGLRFDSGAPVLSDSAEVVRW